MFILLLIVRCSLNFELLVGWIHCLHMSPDFGHLGFVTLTRLHRGIKNLNLLLCNVPDLPAKWSPGNSHYLLNKKKIYSNGILIFYQSKADADMSG